MNISEREWLCPLPMPELMVTRRLLGAVTIAFIFFAQSLALPENEPLAGFPLSIDSNSTSTLHPTNLITSFTTATSTDSSQSIHYGRVALVTGALAGTMAGIHIYQQNGWWKDNRASFHFREDLKYGRWVDKIGHFYGASLMSTGITNLYEWAGIPRNRAAWYGAGASLLFQTYVEIEDGFSTWGFDRVDFAFDAAGAFFPLARTKIPALEYVDLKLSYQASPLLNSAAGTGFRGQQHIMIDDYEGQTFWLTTRFDHLLPRTAADVMPDFLGIALGYGARDVAYKTAHSVMFVALDFDVREIIPRGTPLLRAMGDILNYIHFPAPAVRISPDLIFYGLYF